MCQTCTSSHDVHFYLVYFGTNSALANLRLWDPCIGYVHHIDQLLAAMYNQTLPHGDEAMAETWNTTEM